MKANMVNLNTNAKAKEMEKMKKLLETKTYYREVSEFNEECFEVVVSTEENSEILYDISGLYMINKSDIKDITQMHMVYDDECWVDEDVIDKKYFVNQRDMPEELAEIIRQGYGQFDDYLEEMREEADSDLDDGEKSDPTLFKEEFEIYFEDFVKEHQDYPWYKIRVLYHLGKIVETLEDENGSTLWIEDTNNRFDCETLDKKLLPTEVITLRRNADGEYFRVEKSLYQDSYSLYFYPISEEEAENL